MASEFFMTLAMMNVSIVCFLWIMKQIILLCCWIYKREMERIENNE